MDTITVNVSELWEKLSQIKKDGMEFVTLEILEPEEEFPASLNLKARKEFDSNNWEATAEWDYDYIDAV